MEGLPSDRDLAILGSILGKCVTLPCCHGAATLERMVGTTGV